MPKPGPEGTRVESELGPHRTSGRGAPAWIPARTGSTSSVRPTGDIVALSWPGYRCGIAVHGRSPSPHARAQWVRFVDPRGGTGSAMDIDRFTTLVAQLAGIDRASSQRVVEAVLSTLAEHLSRGEAADVLVRLPPELQPYLHTAGSPERFGVAEFVHRVARRDGSDPGTAEKLAAAVFLVLRQAIGEDEFADLSAQLPREYAPLLSGRSVLDPSERMLARIASLNDTSVEQARRLTEAVLETLAQRIAPGDVVDLAARLPVQLHQPLRRGVESPDRRMSAREFAARVSDRAGIDVERAVRDIPAVLAVLRSDMGDEFFDIRVQLPGDYWPLLGIGPADRGSGKAGDRRG
ncbi:DUF2267 domain-containing protein [Pseudonocardia sp. Cha107L01]|uniref:DUF2267 domain-containing protein n=1 Tax=Pseudonocardia sp. Cha107L01 TaxID=3457576 RepID=UPI00403ED715